MSPDSSFSIRRAEERAANHRASLHGDLFAVLAGASLGALLTTNRSAALHAPKANMKLASTFGSLLCVLFAIGLKVARGQADRFLPAAPFLARQGGAQWSTVKSPPSSVKYSPTRSLKPSSRVAWSYGAAWLNASERNRKSTLSNRGI